MEKTFVHSDLDWEAYKLLSRNVLTEDELDIFYFLTHYFWGRNGTAKDLEALLFRSAHDEIVGNLNEIKAHIENFKIKNSLL